MRWDEAVDRFTTALKMANRSPHTIASYLSDLSLAADYWTRTRGRTEILQDLTNLTSDDIANWFFDLRRQQKRPRTIKRRQASLKLFLAYAVEQHWLDASPYPESGVIRQKETSADRDIVYLSTDQATAFLRAVLAGRPQDPEWVRARDAALFWLLLGTGLRISEACNLTVADIDEGIRLGQLNILGKGDKRRYVALPAATFGFLRSYRNQRPATRLNTFFVTQQRVPQGHRFPITPLMPREVQRRIQYYADSAQLTVHITPHKLRHTFATGLLQAGVDIRVVQEALGHAHLSTTEIYAHVNTAQQKAAVEKLPYLPPRD